MTTTLLDPQATGLMLPCAAVVNVQPRLRPDHLMPAHAADLSASGWPQMTDKDRGAHRAEPVATTTVQGGRIAGIGAAYVTSEFSTRSGPPSCSPPA